MTEPAATPPAVTHVPEVVKPRRAPPSPSSSSRAVSFFTWLVILGAVGWIGSATAPVIAREMGVTKMHMVTRDHAHMLPQGRTGSDAVRNVENGIGHSIDKLELEPDDDMPPMENREGSRIVLPKTHVVLRTNPSKKAKPIGLAARNEPLVVQEETGGWVLVAHMTKDGIETGWVEAAEVARR